MVLQNHVTGLYTVRKYTSGAPLTVVPGAKRDGQQRKRACCQCSLHRAAASYAPHEEEQQRIPPATATRRHRHPGQQLSSCAVCRSCWGQQRQLTLLTNTCGNRQKGLPT